MSFEESMARLDEIVQLLEKGDAPLESALELFEEGTGLVAKCGKLLDSAEARIVKLMKGKDGKPEELQFDDEE